MRVELDLSYLIVSSQYPLLTSMSVSASSNAVPFAVETFSCQLVHDRDILVCTS